MQLRSAICDDEKDGIDLMCRYLDSYSMEKGVDFDKHIYDDPGKLLREYKASGLYDILFLDVEMPISGIMKNGIEVARKIRSIPDNDVRIVFISNYPAYMHMGYDVQASNYLSKNMSVNRFRSVMDGIIAGLLNDSSMMRIKTDRYQWNLIKIHDIMYIQAYPGERDKVTYWCLDHTITETGKSILSVGETLSSYGFAFANKYYLVNMRYVNQFTHNCLQLKNKKYIEISRHYRRQFMEQFSDNILSL